MPAERSLAALRKSSQWRKHASVLTADVPVDVWRELCWRYAVFPGRCGDREAEVVFAIYLKPRRPAIRTALVDALTGEPLLWPPAARTALARSGPPEGAAGPDGRPSAVV
jgi:hypothetical protein